MTGREAKILIRQADEIRVWGNGFVRNHGGYFTISKAEALRAVTYAELDALANDETPPEFEITDVRHSGHLVLIIG